MITFIRRQHSFVQSVIHITRIETDVWNTVNDFRVSINSCIANTSEAGGVFVPKHTEPVAILS